MPEQEPQAVTPAGDGADDGAEPPVHEGEPPDAEAASLEVNPDDRFTISGKPLPLDEFIRTSMGPLAEREPVAEEPQPEPESWEVIWRARRPREQPEAEGCAEG